LVRGKGKQYRHEAELFTKLAWEQTQQGVSVYSLAKSLGVTHGALLFRFVRYGYTTSESQSNLMSKLSDLNSRIDQTSSSLKSSMDNSKSEWIQSVSNAQKDLNSQTNNVDVMNSELKMLQADTLPQLDSNNENRIKISLSQILGENKIDLDGIIFEVVGF
jgi:hypothetical protein